MIMAFPKEPRAVAFDAQDAIRLAERFDHLAEMARALRTRTQASASEDAQYCAARLAKVESMLETCAAVLLADVTMAQAERGGAENDK